MPIAFAAGHNALQCLRHGGAGAVQHCLCAACFVASNAPPSLPLPPKLMPNPGDAIGSRSGS
eukprot:7020453-Prorocentrum_lima.AAC.1